jgi:hypothetical protein
MAISQSCERIDLERKTHLPSYTQLMDVDNEIGAIAYLSAWI